MIHNRLHLVGKSTANHELESTISGNRAEKQQFVEALFHKYRSPLLNYLTRLSGSRDDALELLQETYIRLLKQKSLDHIESEARGYLFKIATNLMLDKSRKDKAQYQDCHQPFLDDNHLDESPSPARQAYWNKTLEHMKEVIRDFPPRCRRVFILHHFKHMTYNEIADLLEITNRTVERDMSLAMTLCKEKLKDMI